MQFLTNNEQICDDIVNSAMLLICKGSPTLNIQSTTLSCLHLAQFKLFISMIMVKVF